MLGSRGVEILAKRKAIREQVVTTKHPGSKRPSQSGYRAGKPKLGGNLRRAGTTQMRGVAGWRKRGGRIGHGR